MSAAVPNPADLQVARVELKRLLVELVRAALVSDRELSARARENGRAAQARLGAQLAVGPAIQSSLDAVWVSAVKDAEQDPDVQSAEDVNPTLPTTCPVDLATPAGASFDFDDVAHTIRESASSG